MADRRLNTSDNIYFINGDNKGDINDRDGYVYGQSVRGADIEFKNWVLSGGYKQDKITSDDGKNLLLDEEKIQEEAKYDGYYSIVTSELEMADLEQRDIYRGLARIEDTFKVSKTEFESRPVYVWTN